MVGTSGSCFIGCGVATPRSLTLPLSAWGTRSDAFPKNMSIWPPSSAAVTWPLPRNGMCTASNPGTRGKERAGEMGDRASAARSVVDLARLRIGDKSGKRSRRYRGADAKDEWAGAENAHRLEILDRIVTDFLQPRHYGNLWRGGEEQRVAVRGSLRHVRRRQRTPRPDAVIDHEALPEFLRKRAARHARHHVSVSTRGITDNDGHRSCRPIRRLGAHQTHFRYGKHGERR